MVIHSEEQIEYTVFLCGNTEKSTHGISPPVIRREIQDHLRGGVCSFLTFTFYSFNISLARENDCFILIRTISCTYDLYNMHETGGKVPLTFSIAVLFFLPDTLVIIV